MPIVYVFDIDGTLCTLVNGDYENASPYISRIKEINNLYQQGHKVVLYTARGMGRNFNNRDGAQKDFEELTIKQLREWHVDYHEIYFGKPAGDVYIDDKGIDAKDFFENLSGEKG